LGKSSSLFRGDARFHQPQGPGIILQLFAFKGFWGEPALAIATKRKVVLRLMKIVQKKVIIILNINQIWCISHYIGTLVKKSCRAILPTTA
jgi:hypothetical protein